LGFRDLKLNK